MFPVVVGGGTVDVVAAPGDAAMAGVLSFEDPEAHSYLVCDQPVNPLPLRC